MQTNPMASAGGYYYPYYYPPTVQITPYYYPGQPGMDPQALMSQFAQFMSMMSSGMMPQPQPQPVWKANRL